MLSIYNNHAKFVPGRVRLADNLFHDVTGFAFFCKVKLSIEIVKAYIYHGKPVPKASQIHGKRCPNRHV